jgi:hypothetical protein
MTTGFIDHPPDCQEDWCCYGLECPVTCTHVIRWKAEQQATAIMDAAVAYFKRIGRR